MDRIINANLRVNSLQVSQLFAIPAGDFDYEEAFLLKNITDDELTLEILPADQEEYIQTVIYPGWNPELVVAVKNVVANTLQMGL